MPTHPENLPDCSRRDFISRLALAGTALPFASLLPASAATPNRPKESATAPGAATCIQAFSKPLQWLSYEATAELVAEAGYCGIDYTVRPGGHVLPERVEDDLPRAVEAARKAGLQVQTIATAIVKAGEPHAEKILKTASKLGIRIYRLGSFDYDFKIPLWDTLQKLKPTLKGLAELNQAYGMHGAYQNHSGIRVGAPLWDLFELLKDFDPRWLGCQYDIWHGTAEGARSWPLGVRLLHPWIKCTDIKDFKWTRAKGRPTPESVPIGDGFVDFDGYFGLLRELNVVGPMSVHFEYPPFAGRHAKETDRRTQFLAAMRKDVQALQGFREKARLR